MAPPVAARYLFHAPGHGRHDRGVCEVKEADLKSIPARPGSQGADNPLGIPSGAADSDAICKGYSGGDAGLEVDFRMHTH